MPPFAGVAVFQIKCLLQCTLWSHSDTVYSFLEQIINTGNFHAMSVLLCINVFTKPKKKKNLAYQNLTQWIYLKNKYKVADFDKRQEVFI